MTQKMLQRLAVCVVFFGSVCHGQSASDLLRQLTDANDLERKDQKPFHLKMAFQIAANADAPAEEGTVEEWWAGDLGQRIEIRSPRYT